MKESKFFEEVMALGAVKQAHRSILRVVELRFGAATAAEFRKAVQGIEDLAQLEDLHRLAIKSRLPQFRKAVAAVATTH